MMACRCREGHPAEDALLAVSSITCMAPSDAEAQ